MEAFVLGTSMGNNKMHSNIENKGHISTGEWEECKRGRQVPADL